MNKTIYIKDPTVWRKAEQLLTSYRQGMSAVIMDLLRKAVAKAEAAKERTK